MSVLICLFTRYYLLQLLRQYIGFVDQLHSLQKKLLCTGQPGGLTAEWKVQFWKSGKIFDGYAADRKLFFFTALKNTPYKL
jgi:hypothetical protein